MLVLRIERITGFQKCAAPFRRQACRPSLLRVSVHGCQDWALEGLRSRFSDLSSCAKSLTVVDDQCGTRKALHIAALPCHKGRPGSRLQPGGAVILRFLSLGRLSIGRQVRPEPIHSASEVEQVHLQTHM
jgi:hypothetical protein